MNMNSPSQLEIFLLGTLDSQSPLSLLRGHSDILRYIWTLACEEWWALHIHDLDNIMHNDIPVMDISNMDSYEYPDAGDRQHCGGCPLMTIDEGVEFPPPVNMSKYETDNPQSQELYVNMMPFMLLEKDSLPSYCQQYWPLISSCIRAMGLHEHYGVAYLTIDERRTIENTPQRRPGLHVESPGVLPLLGKPKSASKTIKGSVSSREYTPAALHHWGNGIIRNETIAGGIFMASNVGDTCAVWNAKVYDRCGSIIGSHGDIERCRNILGQPTRTLRAGELVWMTDRTPHESLPVPSGVHRQYFRLVAGEVTAWFADHSTVNPMGVMPPRSVRIISGDKFKIYRDLNSTMRLKWKCGTEREILKAREEAVLREVVFSFSLGHLYDSILDCGIHSIEGLYNNAEKKLPFLQCRDSYYFETIHFREMLCHIKSLLKRT